ncbi:AMP-binding protein [Gleimia hominis]|uniref:AMP-binding protein n=1 Tax=Gleimia hominis TaxID=595468 RepID=UPI000C804572|nr:AMP-binding protein [Gleimia hominis]WIK64521.1 AMP-binding protein [Gleimia hominis]
MSDPQLMLVPGSTAPFALTRTYSAIHKLWEFFEREEKTGQVRAQWIIVAPRPDKQCYPDVLADNAAALQARFRAVPEDVDVIVETSGSATGSPHLVGLSYSALVASARATHEVLGGPGRWITALPAYHIAGLQTLVRSCVAGTSPAIADMSNGFSADNLVRACRSALPSSGNNPTGRTYLSLVPKQLRDALDTGGELVDLLGQLDAILVGGSAFDPQLRERATEAGLTVVATYGMTETGGGCVYDGRPLPGTRVRIEDGCVELAGNTLFSDYIDAPGSAQISLEGTTRWLRTGDRGRLHDGELTVLGRADDVIISGGVNVDPTQVEHAIAATCPEVDQVCVVGLPDPIWGHVVAAAITLKTTPEAAESSEGVGFDAAAAKEWGPRLRDRVGDALGRDQSPRVVAVAAQLPTTGIGKIPRKQVRTLIEQARKDGKVWER